MFVFKKTPNNAVMSQSSVILIAVVDTPEGLEGVVPNCTAIV